MTAPLPLPTVTPWRRHVEYWKDCRACGLCEQRDRICLARGTIPCTVLFIGEAPGASENAIGQPFVGPAGQLLDKIIERALPKGITYALTNLVACFPAEAKAEGINEPTAQEIIACRPRLIEFVNVCEPKMIVCVGKLATAYINHNDYIPCTDIVHPAAILRMPLAQKQMAVQRAVVTVCRALEDVLGQPHRAFTPWGKSYASLQATNRKQPLSRLADYDNDPPF